MKIKNIIYLIITVLLFYIVLVNCSKDENQIKLRQTERQNDTDRRTIIFGRVPADNVNVVLRQMTPLKNYLEKVLDANVAIRFAQNYDNVVQNLKDTYDMALLGPAAYVKANEIFGAVPLVKPLRDGEPTYVGIIIVRKDSGINTIDDLRNKRIAFTDPQSTSGFIFPVHLFAKHGLEIYKDYDHFFLDGHDNVVLNVLRRRYDAGACYYDARLVALRDNPAQIDELKIIEKTEDISNDPIVAGPRLVADKEWFNKIRQAFLDLNDHPDREEVFSSLSITGYVKAEDEEYSIIREVLNK